ncbi:hypothetical protein EU642_22305 [Salmonella enterica]|nr:hypothetical protein [Salmonella enterica]EAO0118587.1 hypothetical protein [Salmonella enterica]EAO3601690.1 hypothetical protein [Salmonella enterica]EAR6391585.1 hypothetical protein [Salmonella enterica]EAV1285349.1 hypothetical protein [Salmonella enterica]
MEITVTTQRVETFKKRIQRADLKGSTYFVQQGDTVFVTASADHQAICQAELGESVPHSVPCYIRWNNVSATKLVDVLHAIADHKA